MPFFIIWNHWESYLLLHWVIFWNVSRMFFISFTIQSIKGNCWIIFLKCFQISYSWWVIYSFPIILIYKRINFWYSLLIFSNIFKVLCGCCNILKRFIITFLYRVYCCFSIFYPVSRIYIWSTTIQTLYK